MSVVLTICDGATLTKNYTLSDQPNFEPWMIVTIGIRCLAILGLAVFEGVILLKLIFNLTIFRTIGENDCSDDFTNKFFIKLDGMISSYYKFWQYGIMFTLLLILVLEIFYTICIRCVVFKWIKAKENDEESMINEDAISPSLNGSFIEPPSTRRVL